MRAPSSPTLASQTAMDAAADADAASRRIARVTAHPLRAVLPAAQRTSQGDWAAIEIVVVEIETAAGHIGWGECLARRGATAYAAFIDGVLAPLLVGQDALDRRRLWQRMRSVLTGRTGGMLVEAIAGIDIALWDLAGHCAVQSIAQLLGGMGRRTTPVYASSINWFDDGAVEREVATRCRGRLSQHQGEDRPAGGGRAAARAPRAPAGRRCDRAERRCQLGLRPATMRSRSGRVLADCGYAWFEEPLRPEDRRGYRLLRDQLPIRLAAGESDFAAVDAIELIEDRSIGLDSARRRARGRHQRDLAHRRTGAVLRRRLRAACRLVGCGLPRRQPATGRRRRELPDRSSAWCSPIRCARQMLKTPVG